MLNTELEISYFKLKYKDADVLILMTIINNFFIVLIFLALDKLCK